MHADIEIQSAAKLPTRHFRRLGGTGARSALNRLLPCNSASCSLVSSGWIEFTPRLKPVPLPSCYRPSKRHKPTRNQALLPLTKLGN